MKMKIYMSMAITLIVISSSFAFADEAEGSDGFEVQIDDDAKSEIEIMDTNEGVALRLLQLEKAVTCNIEKGEYLVSYLSSLEVDTLEFEAILAEMRLILGEIQEINIDSSDVVFLFVELKQDALDLSNEFREGMYIIVDAETRDMLQNSMETLICEQAVALDEQLKDQIVVYNGRKLHFLLEILGDSDSSLLQEYQKNTILLPQVNQQLASKIQALPEDAQFQIYSELKEDDIRIRIQTRGSIDDLTSQYQNRTCVRLGYRLNNSDGVGNDTIRQFLQQRMRLRLNQSGGNGSGNGGGQGGSSNGSSSGQGGSGSGGSGNGSSSGGQGGSGSGDSGDGNGEGGSGGNGDGGQGPGGGGGP